MPLQTRHDFFPVPSFSFALPSFTETNHLYFESFLERPKKAQVAAATAAPAPTSATVVSGDGRAAASQPSVDGGSNDGVKLYTGNFCRSCTKSASAFTMTVFCLVVVVNVEDEVGRGKVVP